MINDTVIYHNVTDIMILKSPVDYDKSSTYNQNAVLI